MKFYYWLRRLPRAYRAHPMRPKWAWHRARHGWSPRDAWGYDSYLCRSIAGALTHLRDNGHGYFGTPDSYHKKLTRIIEPLEVWGRRDEWDGEVDPVEARRRYHEAQKAFRRIGDMLGHLWD
jgi:hypothetical protein